MNIINCQFAIFNSIYKIALFFVDIVHYLSIHFVVMMSAKY